MTSQSRVAGVAAAICVLALLLAAPASAVLLGLGSGQEISYLPLLGKRSAPQSLAARSLTDLDYGGGPVMASNTNFAVYWRPPAGPEYPPDYQPGINRYFADLAHDSGTATNVDSVATQLNDTLGNFANYQSSFGGPLLDTDPYPANGCQNAVICVTDAQIQAELASFIRANHLPADLAHEYFLLTPPGVESCTDSTGVVCSADAFPNPGYCAYHAFSRTNPAFVYAVDPYVVGNYACDNGEHPNGTTSDGALLGGLSHEHLESVTDPIPAISWSDAAEGQNTGFEIGDKCEYGPQFGTPLGTAPDGAPYNQVINGHLYYYQEEWSNQTHRCLQRFSFAGEAPRARFSSTPADGTTMAFDASATTARRAIARYDWQWNDSAGPSSSQEQTTVPTVTHTFPAPGVYPVALTVFLRDGTSIGTMRFVATEEDGPTPGFSVRARGRHAGAPIAFSGAPSRDPAGSILGYIWNFGDTSPIVGGATVTHTYAAPGRYRVTMTLYDDTGQQASVTRLVKVH